MKYQHSFHAGNFGDVLKHLALTCLLQALTRKDKPLFFLDTHSGRGRYSLDSQAALSTGEAQHGVQRLLGAEPRSSGLRSYLEVLADFDPPAQNRGALRNYPGSGLIAQRLLRSRDRAVLCEIQDAEAMSLAQTVGNDSRMLVECRDGFEALKALVPPPERRGLVLIDPAYELQQADSALVTTALSDALRRWRTGVYCVWYPIKLRSHVEQWHRTIVALDPPPTLVAELCVYQDDSRAALNGAGVLIVNPPWRTDEVLRESIEEIHPLLAHDARSPFGVRWIVAET